MLNTPAYVTKLNPDGTIAWTTQWGTTQQDAVHGVAVDKDGNIFAAGYQYDASKAANQVFVTQLKPDGTLGWTKTWGASLRAELYAVTVDGSGNSFAGGMTTATTPADGQDAWVTKLTPDGTVAWSRQWGVRNGGTRGSEVVQGVAVNAHGDIFAAGYVDVAPPGGGAYSSLDAFVAKLSATYTGM